MIAQQTSHPAGPGAVDSLISVRHSRSYERTRLWARVRDPSAVSIPTRRSSTTSGSGRSSRPASSACSAGSGCSAALSGGSPGSRAISRGGWLGLARGVAGRVRGGMVFYDAFSFIQVTVHVLHRLGLGSALRRLEPLARGSGRERRPQSRLTCCARRRPAERLARCAAATPQPLLAQVLTRLRGSV